MTVRPTVPLSLVVVATLVLGAVPARAMAPGDVLSEPAAREHFAKAEEAFERDDYAAAIPELKAAYAIEPNPMLLYAWAQAERLNGDCERAGELYRRFLDTGPAPEQRRLAEANIVDCGAELGDDGESTTSTATSSTPGLAGEPNEDQPPPRKWYADPAGWALTGLGVVGSAIGAGVLVTGRRETMEAPGEDTESAYSTLVERGRVKQQAGVAVLGIGGGLLLAGVVRFIVVAAQGRRATAREALLGPPGVIRF